MFANHKYEKDSTEKTKIDNHKLAIPKKVCNGSTKAGNMHFTFTKMTQGNIDTSLTREWLETNGLGGYSSSSITGCNTRKYHGLLVVNAPEPKGRQVLLSALEESVLCGESEYFISSREHPGGFYPDGHKYLTEVQLGHHPTFIYKIGNLTLTKELMLLPSTHTLLIRYELMGKVPAQGVSLRIKPLLAYRGFHELSHANKSIHTGVSYNRGGFFIKPYDGMPQIFMQVRGDSKFTHQPDWYYNVEYRVEQERGFPHMEDLFKPGVFDVRLKPGEPVFLSAGLEDFHTAYPARVDTKESVWEKEKKRRTGKLSKADSLHGHLAREGGRFFINTPHGTTETLAGYHWFDAWGRDTLIALPGLTFCAGRPEVGANILATIGSTAKNGLIPNCFATDGISHAYNSVDASLWYTWAVHKMYLLLPGQRAKLKEKCWPVLKGIINAYKRGGVPNVTVDAEGFLHVGSKDTQLTWMDANANGKPVTPRYGCAIEINALWYNALVFAAKLAKSLDETELVNEKKLAAMQETFVQRFWVKSPKGDYLADVWREDEVDTALRPNQLFALSMPNPILPEKHHATVLKRVKKELLTPYGMRTLAPSDPAYCPQYKGGPAERDSAYHQGTVWPWLLGAYGEATIKAATDKEKAAADLLKTIRPLFSKHLMEAGIGSISEIFSAEEPHKPDGCIAQAWSIAEPLRLLRIIEQQAPQAYGKWSAEVYKGAK